MYAQSMELRLCHELLLKRILQKITSILKRMTNSFSAGKTMFIPYAIIIHVFHGVHFLEFSLFLSFTNTSSVICIKSCFRCVFLAFVKTGGEEGESGEGWR